MSLTSPTTITWFGHSTVLIHNEDTWILTDPVLRGRIAHLQRAVPLLEKDWPSRVDAILISHLHLDHLDLPTLHRLGRNIPLLVPVGAGRWLRQRGFPNTEEMPLGVDRFVEHMAIKAVPARHGGRRVPFGPSAAAIGFSIRGPHHIYFAGDTDLFSEMASIVPDLDLALLPVWGWGRSLGTGHLNPERAAIALRLLHPRIAIPIHWGTLHPYATAIRDRHFLDNPPVELKRLAQMLMPEVDIRVIAPGGQTSIT
jgi:L-ascorbate metabolism protein UlaG (beta-lactamase superfamily)